MYRLIDIFALYVVTVIYCPGAGAPHIRCISTTMDAIADASVFRQPHGPHALDHDQQPSSSATLEGSPGLPVLLRDGATVPPRLAHPPFAGSLHGSAVRFLRWKVLFCRGRLLWRGMLGSYGLLAFTLSGMSGGSSRGSGHL